MLYTLFGNYCYPLATCFCDNLVGNAFWYGLVTRKLHRVVRAAAGHRTEIVHVAEHFGEGNKTSYHLHCSASLHTQDSSATTVEITDYIAVEIFSSGYFYQHYRFQQNWSGL